MTLEAPCIVKKVDDCHVVEGQAGKFDCYISGKPTPNVCWYRGDERLQECKQFSMLVQSNESHVLVITHSTPYFEGCYTCVATNSEGSVKSSGNLFVKCLHKPISESLSENYRNHKVSDPGILYNKRPVEIRQENAEDHVTLLDEIGRGKFGIVYKCVDKDTNEEYAAKFVKCRASQRKSVLNEIDIISSLNHDLIVKLVAVFEHSRQYVIIMELVSGGELFEKLMEEELISEMDVTFYIQQVLCAVQHMHSRGILHLDLKPDNIMLVDKNSTKIKLIDLGLACRINKNETTKVMCGTADFISPEVISYNPVSTASDMWSIGVITYVLLSGFSPFAGETDADTLVNVTRSEWDFDDPVFDGISDEAKDFISKLLVRQERKRATTKECLEHPWFKLKSSQKTIRTSKLVSFLAKRNWKKSISAIRASNFLAKLTIKNKEQDKEKDVEREEMPLWQKETTLEK